MLNVLFLGSGTSTGVPVIGCSCGVCRSADVRNKRWRSSLLVKSATTTLLVDSCPDLRAQALLHGITAVDAVVYTHEHLDHTTGFDEMRAFCWRREDRLPLYAGSRCLAHLKRMFGWAFDEKNTYQGYIRPAAHDHAGEPFMVGDIEVTPCSAGWMHWLWMACDSARTERISAWMIRWLPCSACAPAAAM